LLRLCQGGAKIMLSGSLWDASVHLCMGTAEAAHTSIVHCKCQICVMSMPVCSPWQSLQLRQTVVRKLPRRAEKAAAPCLGCQTAARRGFSGPRGVGAGAPGAPRVAHRSAPLGRRRRSASRRVLPARGGLVRAHLCVGASAALPAARAVATPGRAPQRC